MATENMIYKTRLVLHHLLKNSGITSWGAIEEYGATRLSAIIFNLKKEGWDIQDEWIEEYDRYGNKTRFKKYFLSEMKKKRK